MPCPLCRSTLVLVEGYLVCPPCERIGLVPHIDSAKIMLSILGEWKQNLMGMIAACGQDRILEMSLTLRELAARRFTLSYTALDLEVLIGTTALIREILRAPPAPRCRQANVGEAAELAKSYCMLLSIWDGLYALRAGTHRMIHMAPYNLDDLRGLRASDFPLCPTEEYALVARSLAKHGIVTGAAAEQRIREMRKDWEPAELGSKKITSLKKTTSTFYTVSSMLSVALAASPVRQKAFSLPDGERTPVTFFELKGFISGIPAFSNGVDYCHSSHFERLARDRFGDRYYAFTRNFVAGRGNPGALPLFLRIGDRVFISHFFGELYCYALLPVLHKKEFDRETRDRGQVYERTVQKHFEALGFRYVPNVRAKGLGEIDGIAVSTGIAYVIEAKSWASRRQIGDPAYFYVLAQKVRGAIDGMQHERKALKTKRTGVSLPDKVDWVRMHRNRFGIGTDTEIKGRLVVNTVTSVREHSGCEVIFVDDFGLGCM